MSGYKAETQGRYAAAHKVLEGPGDARPTALQIIQDEGLEGKLSDKVVLITGTSSGIGIDTAKALAATGAKCFLGVRDQKKGEQALHDILKPGQVELLLMDLNSLDSIRKAAETFKSRSSTLNILIDNAGIMAVPTNTKTADGHESQFGTNHLAHFLLFQLLKPLLLSSATPEFPSRVVSVSSTGHRNGGIHVDDYGLDAPGLYNPWLAYAQAKTANIYFTNELDRRYGKQNLHGYSLHPGGIATGLQTHIDDATMAHWFEDPNIVKNMKSTAQGAATTVLAAVSGEYAKYGGKYFEDCDVAGKFADEPGNLLAGGYAPHAYDEKLEGRLWVDSSKLVGVSAED